jgi:hypothetical protein
MRKLISFSGKWSALLISALVLATAVTGSQLKHWTETSQETIWRGRYKNCDHGYLVNLPPGVVGHDSLPPSPNHGFLVSAANPDITTEITLEQERLIDVYDSNVAAEIGSARAYVEQYDLKPSEKFGMIDGIEEEDTKFRGWPAVHVHFRRTN